MYDLPLLFHQLFSGAVCKIQGQLRLLKRVDIADIIDKIGSCHSAHRHAGAVHQGLLRRIDGHVVHALRLGQCPHESGPA